eukprot:scaffold1369_cov140-Isochrysis_galbana.AAC.4
MVIYSYLGGQNQRRGCTGSAQGAAQGGRDVGGSARHAGAAPSTRGPSRSMGTVPRADMTGRQHCAPATPSGRAPRWDVVETRKGGAADGSEILTNPQSTGGAGRPPIVPDRLTACPGSTA